MTDFRPPLDVERLRELALAATPGPWRWEGDAYGGDVFAGEAGEYQGFIAVDHEGIGNAVRSGADAAYIAAIDPQTLLGLLDRLRVPLDVDRLAKAWDAVEDSDAFSGMYDKRFIWLMAAEYDRLSEPLELKP
jgi:hypothetical protein